MDARILQQEIIVISNTLNEYNYKECENTLDECITKCSKLEVIDEKQKTAEMIADVYYKLAENYMDKLNLFGGLNCVAGCRKLHGMVPSSVHIVCQLLQCMTGYFYVQLVCRWENENVEDWMDEIFELAGDFSEEISIQQQAAECIQNLMAQCGSFFSPISLAYKATERMEEVAKRFPKDYTLQNVYAHIIISACYFGKETNNKERLSQFTKVLENLTEERGEALDISAIWGHLREIDLR